MTITRMGDELVDMGHNVLVGARSLASLREGASGWRARAAAPQTGSTSSGEFNLIGYFASSATSAVAELAARSPAPVLSATPYRRLSVPRRAALHW